MKRSLIFLICAVLLAFLSFGIVKAYTFFYPKQYVMDEDGEYVNVNAPKADTFPITENTSFIIEYYYPDENRTLTEHIESIPELLGFDLQQTKEYLYQYMQHLSVEEQKEGLNSYELVSYNEQEICFRKTYKKPETSGYIVKSFNGMVVILKSDEKTVYEYTEINIATLPEDLRETITDGYFIETEEELYSFLENYSS